MKWEITSEHIIMLHEGLKEGGEGLGRNVDTVVLGAKSGKKIATSSVEIGITNASQALGSEIRKGLQEAGKSIGSGIEQTGDKLQQGK